MKSVLLTRKLFKTLVFKISCIQKKIDLKIYNLFLKVEQIDDIAMAVQAEDVEVDELETTQVREIPLILHMWKGECCYDY